MRSKYRAIKTVVDGHTFASKREAKRYGELKLLHRAGKIHNLSLQPRYVLQEPFKDASGKAIRAITYVGDFYYAEKGLCVVEDVKGHKTEVYKLKAKLFKAKYPHIELRET